MQNRYYCTKYPPVIGTLTLPAVPLQDVDRSPRRRYVPEIDRMAWGWVEYAEALPPEEAAKYGLVMEPQDLGARE